jgi:hypothetical protein
MLSGRVLIKFLQIFPSDVVLVHFFHNLIPREIAGFIQQFEARNEAEPFPMIGSFLKPSPGFLCRNVAESGHDPSPAKLTINAMGAAVCGIFGNVPGMFIGRIIGSQLNF